MTCATAGAGWDTGCGCLAAPLEIVRCTVVVAERARDGFTLRSGATVGRGSSAGNVSITGSLIASFVMCSVALAVWLSVIATVASPALAVSSVPGAYRSASHAAPASIVANEVAPITSLAAEAANSWAARPPLVAGDVALVVIVVLMLVVIIVVVMIIMIVVIIIAIDDCGGRGRGGWRGDRAVIQHCTTVRIHIDQASVQRHFVSDRALKIHQFGHPLRKCAWRIQQRDLQGTLR